MAASDSGSEPVLISLTAPARRSLVDGLVRPVGSGDQAEAALIIDADAVELAEFLAGIVHTDTGFVARTVNGRRALSVVAATAAALCGEDINAALAAPNIEFLTGLQPPAIEAMRSVLLAIETDRPDEIVNALRVLA